MVQFSTILWFGVLVVAVFMTHWGAEQLTKQLKKLRKQWGTHTDRRRRHHRTRSRESGNWD